MEKPEISVITAVYNIGKYLGQCLDSMLAQTFHEWELIVIDDGSTDDSPAICDEYAARDSRIRVVHKANTGLSDSTLESEWQKPTSSVLSTVMTG